MSRRTPRAAALLAALVAAGLAIVPAVTLAAEVAGVPLPARSRAISENLFDSSLGMRKSVDFYARWLKRQGIAHDAIPVQRYRGVTFARFLSRQPSARWRAIHVYQHRGRTRIAIIPVLTSPAAHAKNRASSARSLGDRLTAGRQTLDLSI